MSNDPDKYKGFKEGKFNRSDFKPSVFKPSREKNKPGTTVFIDESGEKMTKEEYAKKIEKEESKPKFKRILDALLNRKTKTKTGSGKPIGAGIYGKGPLGKNFIGKKLNMGGVMKNRGGTFKGTF